MAYIKFLNSEKVYNAIVIPDGNIVTLTFDSEKEVSNAGFDLFDDEACEVDIGSNFYHDFTTIYRNDAVTSEYNGYAVDELVNNPELLFDMMMGEYLNLSW